MKFIIGDIDTLYDIDTQNKVYCTVSSHTLNPLKFISIGIPKLIFSVLVLIVKLLCKRNLRFASLRLYKIYRMKDRDNRS